MTARGGPGWVDAALADTRGRSQVSGERVFSSVVDLALAGDVSLSVDAPLKAQQARYYDKVKRY